MICICNQILAWDQIEKYEMGRPFITYEGEESCIHSFRDETFGKKVILKPSIDGKLILK
jgi:hypothetical protein